MDAKSHSDSATTAHVADLSRIEQKLDALNSRMATVEKQTAPKKEEPKRHASKIAVATAFALAGLKVGAFFLGKVGFLLVDHPRAFKRDGWQGVSDLWVSFISFGRNQETTQAYVNTLKYTIGGIAVGSTVGPIVAGIVGYTRGDRLEKASDLFMHPIDSMSKIFGPDPKKKELAKDHQAPDTKALAAASATNEGVLQKDPAKSASL